MATDDDSKTLRQDAELAEPLRRVAFEAGMMLGLEATRDEQAYHRRRLTRQQYWLHGSGTLAGMAVSVVQEGGGPVRLVVTPGLGIDGYGREILVHETYCIDLSHWLRVQGHNALLEGWDDAEKTLWLKVTVRGADCDVAMQPVLARKLNLGTDAVQPSRRADSVRLELGPQLPPAAVAEEFQPWACHPPLPDGEAALTAAERAELDALTANSRARAECLLNARLLHAFDSGDLAAVIPDTDLEDKARLLLARIGVHIESTDLSDPAADLDRLDIGKADVSVNNLVRPFLAGTARLAWLARQGF